MNAIVIWFFPFLGIVSLGLVLVNRTAILDPKTRQERFLRWYAPLMAFGFGLLQAIHAVDLYRGREWQLLSAAVFGILGCFGALVLYAAYRWRWMMER